MDTFVIKKKHKEKEDEEGETKSSVSSKKRPAEEESQGLDLEILESTSILPMRPSATTSTAGFSSAVSLETAPHKQKQ